MKSYYRSTGLHILAIIAAVYYLTICVGVDLLHNHEHDCRFHDDCPACQFEVLSQYAFSQADQLLSTLESPLNLIRYEYYTGSIPVPLAEYPFSRYSRAPPPLV
jgi:hypothetical protein